MSNRPPREPRHIVRFAEDGLTQTDNVQVAVGQAQAMIATARGAAFDATVKVEEFSAAATTPEEQALARALKTSLDAVLGQLTSIDDTLKGMRADATGGGRSMSKFNWAFLGIGIAGVIVAVIALLGQ
jgi:hypothetical protein